MTDYYIDPEQPHLGGYILGGDAATHYPELWEWLARDYGVQSMIDVGCGEGGAVNYFGRMGVGVIGIDGVDQGGPPFVCHDYTKGPWPTQVRGTRNEGATDLIWSCEFVEHVHEMYLPNFLETFLMGKLVLMTHAEPDQPGHHHVNCQTADYWIGAMAAYGFRLNAELTAETRALALLNENLINHFARSGLAFVRN